MRSGELVKVNSTYGQIPILTSPWENDGARAFLGRLTRNGFAVVIKHFKTQNLNELEVVTSTGVHGFVMTHHVKKVFDEDR